jgi:hypothetical protein
MIVQYIHDPKKNKLRGVMVANKDEICNYPVISWSYTNFKAGDKFNKQRALEIANARFSTKTNAQVPHYVLKMCNQFKKRVSKYYKINEDSVLVVGKGDKF